MKRAGVYLLGLFVLALGCRTASTPEELPAPKVDRKSVV